MEQAIDEPDPQSNLPDAGELRSPVEYSRARFDYIDTDIPALTGSDEDAEILDAREHDRYTVVVRRRCDGSENCPHDPQVYVVTKEPNPDGGHHLHWELIGRVMPGDDG